MSCNILQLDTCWRVFLAALQDSHDGRQTSTFLEVAGSTGQQQPGILSTQIRVTSAASSDAFSAALQFLRLGPPAFLNVLIVLEGSRGCKLRLIKLAMPPSIKAFLDLRDRTLSLRYAETDDQHGLPEYGAAAQELFSLPHGVSAFAPWQTH